MTFGTRLQELRKAKGYSRADVASLMGMSSVSVEKWELDKRRPSLQRAEVLANLYGLSVNELIGDTIFTKDQKMKASVIATILSSNDNGKKQELKDKLIKMGFTDNQIESFFSMAITIFR